MTLESLSVQLLKHFSTPQEMLAKKQINAPNGTAKEYMYEQGPGRSHQPLPVVIPKTYFNNYCLGKEGKLTLLYKSTMPLLQDYWARKLLSTYGSVTQAIGAYQCQQRDGQRWIVSIEPVAERKLNERSEARVVSLYSQLLSPEAARQLYKTTVGPNSTAVKKPKQTAPDNKALLAKPAAPKDGELKKEPKAAVEPAKIPVTVAETAQQQQLKYYVAARQNFKPGKNQLAACNAAEKAYSYGKLYHSNGTNIYAESGVLVARCLNSVPAYRSKFSNPRQRAAGILQDLATHQNHAVAKHLLTQLK